MNCPKCNYEMSDDCPCEYCWLRDRLEETKAVLTRLKSWMAALYDQDRQTFDAIVKLKQKLSVK